MRPYLVLGAGAVGSALAAYLARSGHPVTAVARPDHAEAIRTQGGLRVVSREESFLARLEATTRFPARLAPETVVLITVQAPDVETAVQEMGETARVHPVVTWQNGIRAEETAAPFCPRLYGGVVRFTATHLVPGEVRLRRPGQLILGKHPRGEDPLAREIVADLNRAGFTAAVSPDIGADKALKLLVNLVSGPPVLLKRTGRDPLLAWLQTAVLEEALRVFAAAGVRAEPASGLGQTPEALLEHFRAGGSPPDTSGGVYNSTWQNLYHRRPRLENDFYHGEIVRLGQQTGVPTPVNARVLAVLEEVRAAGMGPEPFDRDAFRSRFADVVEFPPGDETGAPGEEPPGNLEI